MDVEKKYIFIKSDRSLIIQMDSSQKEILFAEYLDF